MARVESFAELKHSTRLGKTFKLLGGCLESVLKVFGRWIKSGLIKSGEVRIGQIKTGKMFNIFLHESLFHLSLMKKKLRLSVLPI